MKCCHLKCVSVKICLATAVGTETERLKVRENSCRENARARNNVCIYIL